MPRDHTHHVPTDDTDDVALADLLDLEAQVLRSYWTEVLTWVEEAAAGAARDRVLDLGAGTGTGTIGLAQRFEGAEVIAVDSSEEMLRRIQVKADERGLTHRIRTVRADLDAGWPVDEPIDVAWASMSLHHLADPDRVLGDLFASTRPGGLVAVVEFSEPLRFLPPDLGLGRPGLEGRFLDALRHEQAHALPHLGSDWSPRLERAGFSGVDERTFTIELDAPHPPGTVQFAQRWLQRARSALADRLDHDDLATLATLIDGDGPQSLQQRGDLQVRGTRTVTLARRP